ncbi:MAG: hypothetical protein K1X74_01765 [Pirellulales bacterium]|nr:hypothetical protein [Pirellulales bacterium]
MKRVMLAGFAALVISSSSGCCLLDAVFCLFPMHHCGFDPCCGACGWGCERVPPATCASNPACCDPCNCCGEYAGPPHDYMHLPHGAPYSTEPMWEDGGVMPQGQPTPAEEIPPPQPRTSRRALRPLPPVHGQPQRTPRRWY